MRKLLAVTDPYEDEIELEKLNDQMWVLNTELIRLRNIIDGFEALPNNRSMKEIEEEFERKTSKKMVLQKEIESFEVVE